jgi:predicted O-methyltransferase YrrM
MELLGRYKTLIAEVEDRQPKTILEVGTHRGNSAITMVNKAKEYNDDVFYYGFDIFDWGNDQFMDREFNGKSHANIGRAKRRLRREGVQHKLVAGNTVKTLARFSPERQIDFVFIDGGHSVETIESDWKNVEKFMDDETVVIFDDYYENRDDYGCKTLIDELDKDPNFLVDRLDPIEIVEKNNIHLRLAKVKKNVSTD